MKLVTYNAFPQSIFRDPPYIARIYINNNNNNNNNRIVVEIYMCKKYISLQFSIKSTIT